eukprot:11419953-Alexandrium_andersonii.AAC.1
MRACMPFLRAAALTLACSRASQLCSHSEASFSSMRTRPSARWRLLSCSRHSQPSRLPPSGCGWSSRSPLPLFRLLRVVPWVAAQGFRAMLAWYSFNVGAAP